MLGQAWALCSQVYPTSFPSMSQQDEPEGFIPRTPVPVEGTEKRLEGGERRNACVSPPAPLPGVSSLAAAPAFTAQACLIPRTLGSRSTVVSPVSCGRGFLPRFPSEDVTEPCLPSRLPQITCVADSLY